MGPHLSGEQAGGREGVPAAALGCLSLPSTPLPQLGSRVAL